MSRKSPLRPVKRHAFGARTGAHPRGALPAAAPDAAAAERVPYMRVRLPKNKTSVGAPWRYFYLVPHRALAAFVRRGTAYLSYPVTVSIQDADVSVNGNKVGQSGNARAVFAGDDTVHLVVPLRRTADIVPHQTMRKPKARQDGPWDPHEITQMQARVPKEVTLHTAQGAQRLCTACQFFHMMELGACTPGLRDCAEGVILPVTEILRKRKDAA